MQKIDRLGWAAGLSFRSYGVRMGVRVTAPGVLDRVVERLPASWTPSPSPVVDLLYSLVVGGPSRVAHVRRYNLLYSGTEVVARHLDLEPVLDYLEFILRFHVAWSA